MAVTNEQIAELLIGVTRSQIAIIDALVSHFGQDGNKFRMMSLIPVLQGSAHIHNHDLQPTLQDLPSRLLLQLQGNHGGVAQPVQEWLRTEMGKLIP